MNFKRIFKNSFAEIAPLSDSETICTYVMERAKNMSNKRPKIKRAAFAAIAAAAVLTAATVTVGAVTGWDFNSAFNAIFSRQDEASLAVQLTGTATDIDSIVTSTYETHAAPDSSKSSDVFNFEAYGKTLDLWYDFDGYQLNLKGISADRTTAYLLYDVVFDEDYDCSPKEGWTDWEFFIHMDALEEGETKAPITRVYRSHTELVSQQDNVLSFYGMMSLSDINDTLENKIITLDFNDLYRLIPNTSEKDPEPWKDRELFTCGLHVDIPIDFEICTEAQELTLNEKIEFHEYNADMEITTVPAEVKYFSFTPFSWELFIELDTSDFEKGDGYLIDMVVSFKDGTQLDCSSDYSFGHSENGSYYHSLFSQPIVPEQVESVTVTEYTSLTSKLAAES